MEAAHGGIIGWLLLVGVLFGLEIVAIFILVMSLRYAQSNPPSAT